MVALLWNVGDVATAVLMVLSTANSEQGESESDVGRGGHSSRCSAIRGVSRIGGGAWRRQRGEATGEEEQPETEKPNVSNLGDVR